MSNALLIPRRATGPAIYLDAFDRFCETGQAVRGDLGDLPGRGNYWVLVEQMHGARNRRLLMSGFQNAAPQLVFKVDLRGHHAVYVGHYGAARDENDGLYVRLAGEPHFTRFLPARREPAYAEAYYKTVESEGSLSIEIGSFGLRSSLDYIKVVPVEAEPAAVPRGRSFGICDFTTTVLWNKPAGFEAGSCVRQHKDAGFEAIIWKAFKVRAEWHTRIGVRRDLGVPYDTLRQAVDEAKKVGLPIYAWMRLNNEDSKMDGLFAPKTPFHLAHPEQRQARKDGLLRPRTGFAFPEVRQHKIDLIREVAGYGVDGVCIDVLRHPPAVEYDLPLVEAFIKEHGDDPRRMPGDGSEAWLRFKSTAFTQFLREARAALDGMGGLNGRRFPLLVRTMDQVWRNLQCGCDVEAWLREGLVDGLIFAAHLPPPDFYPQKFDLTPWVAMARSLAPDLPVYGQVWNCGSIIEAEALASDMYEQGVAGIAVYESEYAVARSWVREHLWRFSRPESLRYKERVDA